MRLGRYDDRTCMKRSVERRNHIAHVNFCLSICVCIDCGFFSHKSANVGTRAKRSTAQLENRVKDGMKGQIKTKKGYWE